MNKQLLLSALLLLTCLGLVAQTLGEFKPSDSSNGLGKLKKAEKKVYIARFDVNYEVFKTAQDFKQGGSMLGGGAKGSATSKVAVGLSGIQNQDLIEITDELYSDFTSMLKEKGITMIGAEEAGQTKAYEDWELIKGGQINKSQLPGILTVSPTGYSFYVQKVDKKGKQKTGLINNYPALSKDLGDAIIAEISLTVMFTDEGSNIMPSNQAKVKIKTDFRLVDEYVVSAIKENAMLKGAETFDNIHSGVAFFHGKVGLGSTTVYNGLLKKPLQIEGVIKDDKIVAVTKQASSTTATSIGVMSFYSAENREGSETSAIEVDSKQYSSGALMACKKMVEFHTKAFLENID
ncbi:MAG: hypothetical protein RIB47_00520 [Cyclobacteriaceae bacterium]